MLLMAMLQPHPGMRPTASECIQNKWFSGEDRQLIQNMLYINRNTDNLQDIFMRSMIDSNELTPVDLNKFI